ncbi:target of Nesh-SH3-like [Pungitius pungitius]|uniref:target of Nesh-SH3-like n=1 Tax=Pungitius pungitius TaxID=134920 RepID=UPI002E13D2A6
METAALLRVLLLLLGGMGVLEGTAQKTRVTVRINATGDTIVLRFLCTSPEVKLQGFILGYGSSVFSKQFIQLPEDGEAYETELDAEPKYLVAVQPIPANDMKKHCTGTVDLEKPLHLAIRSVSLSAVLLSWENFLKTPYERNQCVEEGFYSIRFRERNRKWIYQSCPTSDTVVDNLKPNTSYQFSVRPNKGQHRGTWSRPVVHNTSMGDKSIQKSYKQRNPLKPHALFPPRPDQVKSFKQTDKLPILKPKATTKPTSPATRQETWEDSALFRSQPASNLDTLGKKRYVAPHVVYQTGKRPDEPCSISSSLNFFPVDGAEEANVTAPPTSPPSNLTVVTVEGCPSFVILDWVKTDNHTTEYEVISTAKGPDGEQVSIMTTNQTHTTVENLRPQSSYEFKVQPKNQLGAGPPSDPVTFDTESADPRVSEKVSGKDAIWTRFPFKTDSPSDCHGKQYVKRTWYRKYVGVQLCNSLRYKIYLSDSLSGKFLDIGDQTGFGEDHCQFVDSFLDGRTGRQLKAHQLPPRPGFYRAMRQEPVHFGQIGGPSQVNYVSWYECGVPIPGKW